MTRVPVIESASADLLDAALYADKGDGAVLPGRAAFALAAGRAFDLAVGMPQGHAARVAYAATEVAKELGLGEEDVRDVLFAALLHDAGLALVPQAKSQIAHGDAGATGPFSRVEANAAILAHPEHGAGYARRLGLGEGVAVAVAEHLHALEPGEQVISAPGAIVGVANRFDSLLDEGMAPLALRKRVPLQVAALQPEEATEEVHDAIAAMAELASRDTFWLGFYDNDLAAHLAPIDRGAGLALPELVEAASVMGEVIDTRNGRERGHSEAVSELAYELAAASGFPAEWAEMVGVAALLQDVGTFGVPMEVLSKPDLLTVDEMALTQQHPVIARDLLSEVPGLGPVAWWVGCHHERIDGKGYPSMLAGEEVPIEAQCIGLAETYWALRSERPYRPAMAHGEAMEVIEGMADTRFEREVVDYLEAIVRP